MTECLSIKATTEAREHLEISEIPDVSEINIASDGKMYAIGIGCPFRMLFEWLSAQ